MISVMRTTVGVAITVKYADGFTIQFEVKDGQAMELHKQLSKALGWEIEIVPEPQD